jgi:isochorismate synthase
MEKVLSKTTTIFEALKICLEKDLTFAIYRLPRQQDITLVLQKNRELSTINDADEIQDKKGFMIAPFVINTINRSYIIQPDYIFKNELTDEEIHNLKSISNTSLNGSNQLSAEETSKEDFIHQLEVTISKIKNGEYDKVVLSRTKKISGKFSGQLSKIFALLCESYTNAFVYLFSIKGHCWVGATPEPLICNREDELFTVSLAGTRPYSEDNMHLDNWNHKERVEQEYVTDFIKNILSEHNITDYSLQGPYTKKAGRLIHLRTDFSFPGNLAGQKLTRLIRSLHPTSAICGMPMEKSLQYIQKMEKHNREYYAGYLGPIGIDGEMQLFVNLRCMKVLQNELILYVGSGITSESNPEDEWDETEIKADTLLSIVQQIN